VSCETIDQDLDAYGDRELDGDAAEIVREHLARCAPCRARIAERQALGRLVRSAPYYTAPDRLRARVSARIAQSHPRATYRVLSWAVAAALVVAVGGGFALVRTATVRQDAIVGAVVDGHVRSLMADHLFDVRSTDQHTVKPWFLGKLDFAPPVVDLSPIGFPLVGGRLEYLSGRPVAALVYQRQQHTINVFVAPAGTESPDPINARTLRGFHVHHWIRDGMSFWAVSDLNDRELTEFVRALSAP
jgi:anti-sigma factor RsiW